MTHEIAPEDEDRFRPGTVRSLWDMYKLEAQEFIDAVRLLYAVKREFADVPPEEELAGDMTPLGNRLESLFGHLLTLQTKTSAKTVRDLLQKFDKGPVKAKTIIEYAQETERNMRRELEDRFLYTLDEKYSKYVESADPPYGGVDLTKFGEAHAEISEAAKCLALRRYKATVFHLMLAMEEAVRVVADANGATTHDDKGRWLPWGTLANNIEAQVIRPMGAGSKKLEWQNANAMLRSVANAWRNPTDHPGATYSEEAAVEIFNAVKGFMRALGPLA